MKKKDILFTSYVRLLKYSDPLTINGLIAKKLKLNNEYVFEVKIPETRVYRIMRHLNLKSVCRRKKKRYLKSNPQITAGNILNREFKADNVGEKWLIDVTEMKYDQSGNKAYLSAIHDLGDKNIVSFVLGKSNNNELVFKTFGIAIGLYPDAKPIFHSDKG